MCPENEATSNGGQPGEKQEAPSSGIESRLSSQDKRIAYLIQKISRMEKKDLEVKPESSSRSTGDRLGDLKRVLADHGLETTSFDEEGFVRLKPQNELGFDTLRKLNTLFHVSLLESYFDNLF